jgi:glutathione S-transferase
MKARIHEMRHSPYCIPITRALDAWGAEVERVEVPNWDRSDILRLTGGACYTVPVLELAGEVVFETDDDPLAVAHHVDREVAGGALFPGSQAGLQAILIPHIEDVIEGVTFRMVDPFYIETIADVAQRGMVRRHKERKFGRGCIEAWRRDHAQLAAQARALLEPFDQMLGGRPFLLGNAPVYTDFALFGILGNLTYREWNRIPAGLDRLVDWYARLERWSAIDSG